MTTTLGVLLLVVAWLGGVLLAAEGRRRVVARYGRERLPRVVVLRAQLVGTALNRIVPWGGGLLSVHGKLLAQRGHSAEVIAACLGGYAAAGLVAHAALFSTAVAVMAFSGLLPHANAPVHVPAPFLLAAGGLVLVLAASVSRHPATRRLIARPVRAFTAAVSMVRREPLAFLHLCALQVLAQLVVLVGLLGALLATGTHVPYLAVLTMALVTTAVASLVPAPAGTGPAEAGLIGGLLLLGIGLGPATAGVVLFRLVTHWLPVPVGAALATRELWDFARRRRVRRVQSRHAERDRRYVVGHAVLATVD